MLEKRQMKTLMRTGKFNIETLEEKIKTIREEYPRYQLDFEGKDCSS